eukprot:TRINITY_DN122223_c0_g1_i1.p1 TRINITY_DN122223_c0_g1~~TRINITY_DN122223_c0_g1_i1.p1  ORF type:complete len:191 (-),score=42.29 TRINITY_DN122223_c0_g1_i1:46-618(-)
MATMSKAQLLKTLIPAAIALCLQKVNLEELGLLPHVQAAFIVGQAVCAGLLLMIRSKIVALKDSGEKVHVPPLKSMGVEVKPASIMTVSEYDDSKWKEQLQQQCMGALIGYGIFLQWGYILPMAMQVVMAPMNLVESPLGKVHLMGKAARGDLVRPWPQPNPFGLAGMSQGQTAKERKQEAKKAVKEKKK